MDSFFSSAFCMCWLIPFVGTVALVMLSHGIHQSWQSRRVTDGFPHCAGCQYNLQGISKLQCPECGKRLHVDAVLFRGDRKPLNLSGRLLMWTTFLPGPMLITFMLFTFLWPTMYKSKWNATLQFTAGQQSVNVAIDFEDTTFFERAKLQEFDALMATGKPSPRNAHVLNVDVVNDRVTWDIGDSSDSQEGPLNRETLVTILDDFQLLDQQLDARPVFADTLLDLIKRCQRESERLGDVTVGQTHASWSTNHYASRVGKDTGNVVAILGTLLLGGGIWAWGLSIVTRHYEKDWQRYCEARQKIYSRFREHIEVDASAQSNPAPNHDEASE